MRCVFHVFPEVRNRVYVDEMNPFLEEIFMDLPESTKEVI